MSYQCYGLVKTEHLMFILSISSGLILLIFLRPNRILKIQNKLKNVTIPPSWIKILKSKISYYVNLNSDDKYEFEKKIQLFLNLVKITGIGTSITLEDKILIAAGAVIPVFKLNWFYDNLHEILLYPNTFDEEYHTEKHNDTRRILGMVGTRSMENIMILSKDAVHLGFTSSHKKKSNVIIHESAHLIDKADGNVDGIPEISLNNKEAKEWVQIATETIQGIRNGRIHDINPYASTNISEFFAVLSEYFFKDSKDLERNHPNLYRIFCKIYNQAPN